MVDPKVHHMRCTSINTKMQALSRSEAHSSQNRVPFQRFAFIQDHLTNALPSDEPVSAFCYIVFQIQTHSPQVPVVKSSSSIGFSCH